MPARSWRLLERLLQVDWPELRVVVTSVSDQWAQIACAGPESRAVLARAIKGIDFANDAFPMLGVRDGTVADVPVRVFRVSYSGELAYEVAVPSDFAVAVWTALLDSGAVPYGLEAMGAMRIEKGHVAGPELSGQTTPADLGLGRLVSAKKNFIGKPLLQRAGTADPARPALVGLVPVDGKTPIRAGAQLIVSKDTPPPVPMIGYVTSVDLQPDARPSDRAGAARQRRAAAGRDDRRGVADERRLRAGARRGAAFLRSGRETAEWLSPCPPSMPWLVPVAAAPPAMRPDASSRSGGILTVVQVAEIPGSRSDRSALERLMGLTLPGTGPGGGIGRQDRALGWAAALVRRRAGARAPGGRARAGRRRIVRRDRPVAFADGAAAVGGKRVRRARQGMRRRSASAPRLDRRQHRHRPGAPRRAAARGRSGATVDVYVYRSFAQDLFEWLTEAAAEYGFEIVGLVPRPV